MSVVLAEKYLPILDAVYKKASLTSVFDARPEQVKFNGGNKVELFATDMNGLGDYSRTSGYVGGTVNAGWKAYTLSQDRGRKFTIDAMDNEETLNMMIGNTMGEFLRTRVVPEIDAYRFSKLAGTSNILTATADITPGTTDVPSLIDVAEEALGDAEVPEEGRILFISENAYRGLKDKITRTIANENGVQKNIEIYDNMRVIRVPKGRFCTGIDLMDGTTSGETGGGYEFPATTSKPINFMIVDPNAILSVVKHVAPKMISPEANQTHDGWGVYYRVYHDIFADANKLKGIYAHIASTGLSAKITG